MLYLAQRGGCLVPRKIGSSMSSTPPGLPRIASLGRGLWKYLVALIGVLGLIQAIVGLSVPMSVVGTIVVIATGLAPRFGVDPWPRRDQAAGAPPAPPAGWRRRDYALGFLAMGVLWSPHIWRAWLTLQPPGPMQGSINIVVADFVVADNGLAPDLGEQIALALYQSLDSALTSDTLSVGSLDIERRGPTQVPSIAGATAVERAEHAQALADALHADIVVFGMVEPGTSADNVRVTAELFVSRDSSFGLPEFTGSETWSTLREWPLGTSASSRLDRIQFLSDELSALTRALLDGVLGIWDYRHGRYAQSLQRFSDAESLVGLNPDRGLAVWLLWQANAAAQLDDLERARGLYERALNSRPDYGRAYVGLAEVEVAEAAASLQGIADQLAQAEVWVARAEQALDAPPSADIGAKVLLLRGRIAALRYYKFFPAQNDQRQVALDAFSAVIQAYEAPNPRLRELAATAYLLRGKLYRQDRQYELTEAAYLDALALTRNPRTEELLRSGLATLPRTLLSQLDAQASLSTAIALSADPTARARYELRYLCLETPAPDTGQLICE